MILATVANYGRNSWLLRCGSRRLEVGPPPVIMGIINVTPDSFSDGGRFLDAARAAEHGLAMIEAGATILDIGGESARPGAAEVSPEEEIARSEPVVAALRKQCQAVLSIDTRKVQVARAALAAGADMINDITALGDPAMAALAAEARCPVVLMHMQGTPQTMQSNPVYDHLVADVCRHLRRALGRAVEAGIDIEQTIVDPGIGFGKTVAHNLSLLGRLKELRSMGRPLLVGASRKSFIGKILGPGVDNRLTGSLAACLWTRAQGAAIFRVHDVAETAAALQMAAAMESAQDGC
ncbi:MAG: dihydropteroate synthase [Anaerolineaceae bacterium]|nr:dihydropteroate synthase [Anaerolineaceae bacterium]